MAPLVPPDAVRSATTRPRTPRTGLLCICTVVAGDLSPSYVPVIVSFVPVSAADTDPDPLIVDCMVTSIGTGESLALNVLALCAPAADPSANAPAHSTRMARVDRIMPPPIGGHDNAVLWVFQPTFRATFSASPVAAARFAGNVPRTDCRVRRA